MTPLDEIERVDTGKTGHTRDDSGGYAIGGLFLEIQLRQMPLTDPQPRVAPVRRAIAGCGPTALNQLE